MSALFADGYIYYDLFNQILGSNMVQLVSPLITSGDDTQLCFSFWYAAFGAGDSAVMQVIRQDNSSGEALLDKVTVSSQTFNYAEFGSFGTQRIKMLNVNYF